MTSAMFTELLQCLSLLGVFLLIGVFLRAKMVIFQKTFIPASIIGGFLLLLLGPQALNVLPVSSDWFSVYSLLPGILVVPVVAAVPLGLRLTNGNAGGKNADYIKNVIPLIFIAQVATMLQYAVGFGTHLAFSSQNLYDVFGVELSMGFVGGHSLAGTLGNLLSEMNLPYWETSQGVATTTATFGIVGGILTGIAFINWGTRNGHTAILKKAADIPLPIRVGFEKDIDKQASIGRETTMSASIDTLAFHLAIIFSTCGLAYCVVKFVTTYQIPILSSISVWVYGMILMFFVWGFICKFKMDYLVDVKVKNRITGCCTEFAVIAAIASLPIQAVAAYIVPILVMVVLGFVVTFGCLFFLCKRYLKGYWFEHMISVFGMASGVFLTGLLLLRICDPELETPTLANYSLAFTISGIVYYAMLNFFIMMPFSYGILTTTLVSVGLALLFTVVTIVSSRVIFGKDFKGN